MTKHDPRPRVMRGVIIDLLPYSATDLELLEMQDRLGLVPSSLDTLELERNESNNRIALVKPLSKTLVTMAGYASEALAEYFVMNIDSIVDEDDDEEEDSDELIANIRKSLINQNKQVVSCALHAVVSHLVQTGVLVFGEGIDDELLG